jgi:hypothetical protein
MVNKTYLVCAVPYCRDLLELHFYGKPVCNHHWVQHCEGKIDLKKMFNIVG